MYGAVATTPGVLSIFVLSDRQSRKISSVLTRICASKSITFWRSSRSKPVITEITRIRTVTPSITPNTEISVMMERNVRFGFKYRSARKTLKGSFKSAIPWLRTQNFANNENMTGPLQAQMSTNETQTTSVDQPNQLVFQVERERQHAGRYRLHAAGGVQYV